MAQIAGDDRGASGSPANPIPAIGRWRAGIQMRITQAHTPVENRVADMRTSIERFYFQLPMAHIFRL